MMCLWEFIWGTKPASELQGRVGCVLQGGDIKQVRDPALHVSCSYRGERVGAGTAGRVTRVGVREGVPQARRTQGETAGGITRVVRGGVLQGGVATHRRVPLESTFCLLGDGRSEEGFYRGDSPSCPA